MLLLYLTQARVLCCVHPARAVQPSFGPQPQGLRPPVMEAKGAEDSALGGGQGEDAERRARGCQLHGGAAACWAGLFMARARDALRPDSARSTPAARSAAIVAAAAAARCTAGTLSPRVFRLD